MLIGWKENDNTKGAENTVGVQDTVDDLSEVANRDAPKIRLDRTNSEEPSANNHKNIIVIVIIVAVLVACAYGLYSMQHNPEMELNSKGDKTEQVVKENNEKTVTEDTNAVKETQPSGTEQKSTGTSENNPNAVYDEKGNLISSNGIYDEDGNIITQDEDVIDTGLPNFEDSTNSQTTATVYSDSDFIKDLNGVDVPAVYNVKSRDYVKDFVNYEAKRAIIDDGMEMYWLEVVYNGKHYRVQVPFYVFKDLDKTGICVVELEVLTLEGGEKIISYMQVITDYSSLGK